MSRRPKGTALTLTRWTNRLGVLPKDARLELRAMALEPYVLHAWPLAVVGEAWAGEVMDIAQDDCDARGEVCEYRLEVVKPDGSVLSTQPVRCVPRDAEGELPRDDIMLRTLEQQNSHIQALMRSHVQTMEIALRNQRESFNVALESVSALLKPLTKQLEQAHADNAELRELARDAMAATATVVADEEERERSERRTKQWEKLGGIAMTHFAKDNPQLAMMLQAVTETTGKKG